MYPEISGPRRWLRFILITGLVAGVWSATVAAAAEEAAVLPSLVPEKDPPASGDAVKFLPAIQGKHPRLIITADRLPALRAFYNSEQRAFYRGQVEALLPQCVIPANRKFNPWNIWFTQAYTYPPTAAMHYLLTGDKDSLSKGIAWLKLWAGKSNWNTQGEPAVADTPEAYARVLQEMKQLRPSDEINSDADAAFVLAGTALTWDWLYNDLDPTFREQFRETLWQHARAIYYGGHLHRNPGGEYWVGVGPGPNHRWIRDWALAMAVIATSDGKPEQQWMLGNLRDELEFIAQNLSPDGISNEGPDYGEHVGDLVLAFEASDECFGTHLLDREFFRRNALFGLEAAAPGQREAIYFSDCFLKCGSIYPYMLKLACDFKQPDVLDGLRRYARASGGGPAWESILWDDPTVSSGDCQKLPTTIFYPNLGVAIMRDRWAESGVAALFKCGLPEGLMVHDWRERNRNKDGTLPSINAGHAHPDANTFTLFGDGEYLAETDRYPIGPGKLTSSQNSILINGMGQMPKDEFEGNPWYYSGKLEDADSAKITAWRDAGDVVIVEGEASGSYLNCTHPKTGVSRPALDRFRRTFIWVKGGYVLVLDDIRAPRPVAVTWLMQAGKLTTVNEAEGRYRLSKNQASCDFQLRSDAAFTVKMAVSTANDHRHLCHWNQLQATVNAARVRFVSVYDPWHRANLSVAFAPAGPDRATVTVTGAGLNDTWTWNAATGKFVASTIRGKRAGGFDLTMDAATAVPPPMPQDKHIAYKGL